MNEAYGFPQSPQMYYGSLLREEKRNIRRQSNRAGLCVIAFVLVQQFVSFVVVRVPALRELYFSSTEMADITDMFLYLACTFLPFLVAFWGMNPREKDEADLFGKPVSMLSFWAAVFAGLFFCNVGNFVTGILTNLYDSVGITSDGGTYDAAPGLSGFLMQIVTIAVLPALVEEFALRSVVMQPLRRYGDRFAIVMSSLVFALMHSDLLQSPFAFIAGAAMGYFAIATGSIWTSVAIHFGNNLYSVILTTLLDTRPTVAEKVYSVELAVSIVLGVIALALFIFICKRNKLQKTENILTTGEKARTYIFTIPMILSILFLIVETIGHVHMTGVTNG